MTAPTVLLPPAVERPLLVRERFGPTFQGEGASTGQLTYFLRLWGCNLHCPRCDTPDTWDRARFDPANVAQHYTAEQLADWLTSQPGKHLVVTGGEPLMQQRALLPLLRLLPGYGIEIETNGTIAPLPEVVELVEAFNVSPKLASFAAPSDRRTSPKALRALAGCGKARFKFVVSDVAELDEVGRLVAEFALTDTWVMPEGTNSDAVIGGMRKLADAVLERGWNLSTRLHVLLWEDERGR
ncbi:7-carboxy-7-deazaguanine synthase QueE [Kitasatospora sp. MBT63]|uniref:7-carboxy-7-deazaguanine synthase QueE n=1 Tax=Kitasatospora sp. MBT63 TaxID=1444768 RepID=UPI00068ACB5B|nr:7-carboxy-7-deazaguanine synthase QueE [Kitasatospora sp. MBT63]